MHAAEAATVLHRLSLPKKSQAELDARKNDVRIRDAVYSASLFRRGKELFALARLTEGKRILIVSPQRNPGEGFSGTAGRGDGFAFKSCPLTGDNAAALREAFPWTAPVSLADRQTTLGCGDRLGRATPGHLRALRKYRVSPVLAQQSVRELSLTGRTFQSVVDDAAFLVFQCGYTDGYGADGDHLKTLDRITQALDGGMTMITLDLSDVMKPKAALFNAARVEREFRKLSASLRAAVRNEYAGRSFSLRGPAGKAEVSLDDRTARLCAVMYGPALRFAVRAHEWLVRKRGKGRFDLEISIDETTTPTPPSHHLFVIRELIRRGVTVSSLAPRFTGEFQKGVDYAGDTVEFGRQLAAHVVVAQTHGDYKISVHSGSDKFSIFAIAGRVTGGRLHVKTAGTSWLEAVRLIAAKAPSLYRKFHDIALKRLEDARKLYHITPDLSRIPLLSTLRDEALPALMDQDAPRQVLHVAYGFILADPRLRAEFFNRLDEFEEDYYGMLERHFTRHLEALGVPRR
jgi:hypothetical protein